MSLAMSLALQHSAIAREHLVGREEVAARLQGIAAERAGNRLKIDQILSSRLADVTALAYGVDVQRLRAGVAALSGEELRDLARRADTLQADPAAGGTVKTLVIVGAVILVVVLLAAAIVESCKEQGAECLD